MTTGTRDRNAPDAAAEEKIRQFRARFDDAPELGKRALENVLAEIKSQATETPPPSIESAGRIGVRLGKVSTERLHETLRGEVQEIPEEYRTF